MIGLDHFSEEADNRGRSVKLPSPLPFRHSELAQEIFVNPSKGVVVERCRNFGDFFQQFLE